MVNIVGYRGYIPAVIAKKGIDILDTMKAAEEKIIYKAVNQLNAKRIRIEKEIGNLEAQKSQIETTQRKIQQEIAATDNIADKDALTKQLVSLQKELDKIIRKLSKLNSKLSKIMAKIQNIIGEPDGELEDNEPTSSSDSNAENSEPKQEDKKPEDKKPKQEDKKPEDKKPKQEDKKPEDKKPKQEDKKPEDKKPKQEDKKPEDKKPKQGPTDIFRSPIPHLSR